MKTSRLLLLDLEMTDADVNDIEITEIGLCLVGLEKCHIFRRGYFIVRPKNIDNLTDECIELTGLTKSYLKRNGRPLNEVLNNIKKDYPLKSAPWGAWGTDNKQIAAECKSKGIENPFNTNYINISTIYAFMKHLPLGIAMEKAMAEYNMKFEGKQHRARDDAHNLGRLALRMFNG